MYRVRTPASFPTMAPINEPLTAKGTSMNRKIPHPPYFSIVFWWRLAPRSILAKK
jgi:hypothetical protein